jgi:hypothetical protein
MHKPLYYILIIQLWLMTGCRSPGNHPSNASAAAKTAVPKEPLAYTRISGADSNVVQLQVAVRKFLPAHQRGPAVYLVGVMHVGEPEYYHALQRFLDAQNVVLYEGVDTEAHRRQAGGNHPAGTNSPSQKTSGKVVSKSLQQTLAQSLGLVFQLDAIDYDRTNFVNSDLSVAELQNVMSGPAGSGAQAHPANASFDVLLQIMDGSSFLGSLFKLGIQFIGADPKLQAIAKLTLVEAIGRLQGDLSDMRNLPPDLKQLIKVLIETRNQKVLADLRQELKTIPRSGSAAIFYGAGHMHDLERRLTADFNYRPAGETWFNAFSVDLQKNGITPAQAASMRAMVKWQLDQMQEK